MVRQFLLLVILLCVVSSARAQEACNRHSEPRGGFSLCVPDGWTAQEKEGQKYKLLFAPAAERFVANINMKDDISAIPLEDYATASVEYIVTNYSNIGATDVKALTRAGFTTEAGLAGIRATFHAEYKGLLVRTIQYYFNGNGGQKLLLTCTLLEADRSTFDAVCDRAARSLKLEDKGNPPKPD